MEAKKQIRVLGLGVHTDDLDYSIGGTAMLLADAGCEVKFITMTSEQHIVSGEALHEPLPLPGVTRELYRPEDGFYTHDSEKATLGLEKKIREFAPDILFLMWPRDNHMEHAAAAKIQINAAFRAGRIREAYAYEVGPLQTMSQFGMPDITVDISSKLDELQPILASYFTTKLGADCFMEEKEVSARFRGYSAYANFRYGESLRVVKLPEGHDDFLLRQLLGDKFRWGGVGAYWIGRRYYDFGGNV